MLDMALVSKTSLILLIALISPGPDFVMVLRNSLNFGRKAGILAALGIASGCLVSFSVVIIGLEFLFKYPLVQKILSIICGSYLIYIGFITLRSKQQHHHIDAEGNSRQLSNWNYYCNGLLTNLFNPKLYSLVTAILTYVEQQKPSLATNASIVIGQGVMAMIWFGLVSIIFSHSKIQDAYLRREQLLNYIVGFIFIIIGSRIMFGC
ncbi:MAG: hypothetical protein RLZZ293_1321 [Pseudomonadota bacterium]